MTQADCEELNLKLVELFKSYNPPKELGYTLLIKLENMTAIMGYNTQLAHFAGHLAKLVKIIAREIGVPDTAKLLEAICIDIFSEVLSETPQSSEAVH